MGLLKNQTAGGMKKADCDGTRLITDVVGIEKWRICDVGTPAIWATDKDVGKDVVSHFRA